MPLEKSAGKAAFKHNVRQLVKDGYAIKEALAISYAKKREAGGK